MNDWFDKLDALLRRACPWLVFLFALGVQFGYGRQIAADPSAGRPNGCGYKGVPIGDAKEYYFAAVESSQGRTPPEGSRPRRMLYSHFLALFFYWLPHSITLAIVLNILLTCGAVGLLAAVACRLGGPGVGIVAGVWLSLMPYNLVHPRAVMSESLGYFLLAWHLERLVACLHGNGFGLFGSGVLLGVSNAVRSLTVFVIPMDLVAIVLLRVRRGAGWRTSLSASARFGVGVGLVLGAAVYQNYRTTGIASLSDNIAMHLYCATSPQFERFDMNVEKIPESLGILDQKGKYDFYMAKAKEQFLANPKEFFRKFHAGLKYPMEGAGLLASDPIWTWLPGILASLLVLGEMARFARTDQWRRWWRCIGLVLVAVALTKFSLINRLFYPLVLAAYLRSVIVRNDDSVLLGLLALAQFLTAGVFVYWEDRIGFAYDSMVEISFFLGFRAVLLALTRPFLGLPMTAAPAKSNDTVLTGYSCSAGRAFLVIALAFFLLSVTLVGVRHRSPLPRPYLAADSVPPEPIVDGLRFLANARPQWFTESEKQALAKPINQFADLPAQSLHGDWRATRIGSLVYDVATISTIRYSLPAGFRQSLTASRYLNYREFDRTIFYLDTTYRFPQCATLFPDRLDAIPDDRFYLILGRAERDDRFVFEEVLIAAVGLIPYDPSTHSLNLSRAILAREGGEYDRLLRALVEASARAAPIHSRSAQ